MERIDDFDFIDNSNETYDLIALILNENEIANKTLATSLNKKQLKLLKEAIEDVLN